MAPVEHSGAMASITQLAEALVACPEEEFLPWVQTNRHALSFAFLQHLKDTYISASTILEDPIKTDRLSRYALTIASVIAFHDPLVLALAQWMRGLWAMYNAISEAAVWFRAALPVYKANNDELSVARLLSNLVGVLATIGETNEAEACYHQARPFFVEYAAHDPKFLIYHEQSFGWLLHNWGRYEEALDVHQHALALARMHNLSISIAEIQVNLCLTLAQLGRLRDIEAMLMEDRAIALQAGELITVARIDMNLGELYTTQGRPIEALRCFQQATSGFVAMEQGFVLSRQATLLRQLGALPAALRQYDLALKSLEQYKLKPVYIETLMNQATCLRRLGNFKALRRASKILSQVDELWQEIGNSFGLIQVYLERVLLALAQNQNDEALRLLKEFPTMPLDSSIQAEYQLLCAETHRLATPRLHNQQAIAKDYEAPLRYAAEQKLHWLQRSALHGMGKLFIETDWPKARHFLEEAALVDDRLRQTLTVQELKASFHEEANNLYDDLIHHAYRQQKYELVLLYAWRAKASAFLDLAYHLQDAAAYTLEQQQEINLLRQQIAALRWSLAKDAADRGISDSYEKSNPELANLTEQLLAVKRQSQQKQWSSAGLTIDQLQTILAELEADLLLEYVRCDDKVYCICANRTGVQRVIQLADAETLTELVGNLALTFYSFELI
jgi:tetratricopeptide (TPR) repeat protein